MVFWGRLNDYREHKLQSSGKQSLTPKQASNMLDCFKYDELWYDLTWKQQRSKGWKSTLTAITHKRAGWTHAARAILQYGLPKLERPAEPNDATEHINALGQFAQDMAKWLVNFAISLHDYMQTEGYQNNYQKSLAALEQRTSRASGSR